MRDAVVSVIIPAYNRERTIKAAVKSVLNQTFTNIEVIVVDDCSSDNTCSVLNDIDDDRLRVIRLEKNSGACAARNEGIKESKGVYIAFQDSDDVWHSDKLEKQIAALKYSNADICFCAFNKKNINSENTSIYPVLNEGIISYSILASYSQASTQTIISKRNIFDQELFDPQLPRLQDFDWMIRSAKKNKVTFVAEPLVDVYVQNDSISTSNKKLIDAYRMIINKYPETKVDFPEIYNRWIEWYAKAKILDGECDVALYKELFSREKTLENFIKYCMARIGLLKPYMYHKLGKV